MKVACWRTSRWLIGPYVPESTWSGPGRKVA